MPFIESSHADNMSTPNEMKRAGNSFLFEMSEARAVERWREYRLHK